MLNGVGPAVALGRDTRMLQEILDKTAERLGKDLGNQPEVEAELRSTIGNVYDQLGLYEKASAMHRAAVAIHRSLPGDQDHQLVEALKRLANALAQDSKFAEAETNATEAVAIARRLPDHEHLAGCLNTLAFVLQPQGRVKEAVAIHRQVLDLRKSAPETSGEELAGCLNNLATALRDLAEFPEAEKLYREALELATNSVPPEHPLIAKTLNNLGMILQDQRKFTEAEPLLRRALDVNRKLQGDDEHPDYAVALSNLAKNLVDQGKVPEAEVLFRQALEKMKKTLPPKHPNIATAINNLAYTLSLTNDPVKLTEAASMFQQALDMQRELLGEDNQAVALSLNNLSSVLKDLGRLSEAEARQREALGKWRKVYGDEHPVVAKSLGALTDALMSGHKYDEAVKLCNELLPPELENRRTDLLMIRIGVLARGRRWKEAAADAAKIVSAKPDNHAHYGHMLTMVRLADGDREGARQACQQTLARFTATNDPNAAVRMAMDCLVIPLAGVDVEAAARLADSALAKNSTNVFYQFCKGLAEYRHGRFASAVAYMAKPLESHGHTWDDRLHLQAHVVLAMAHWQLKQADQARAALAEALELAETTLPKADSGDLGVGWQDWIISHSHLAEAKALIGGGN